jgi:hypothetical protein
MKKTRLFTNILAFGLMISFQAISNAGITEVTNWLAWDATTATGTLSGITISASTNSEAEFVGFTDRHFGAFDGECGSWDGQMPLTHDDEGLIASNVNGGDYQQFSFDTPLTDGLLYVENFDSSSMAMLTATGATSITVVDQSDSISYTSTGADSLKLTSSNAGYDGEGDAVFHLAGDVTNVRLDFSAGDGANGVIYTFAKKSAMDAPNAVPEPTSLLVMAGLFGLGSVVAYRRRQK